MRNETQQQTHTLTTGSVRDFFRYLGINGRLLMCYIFWICSEAEGNVISEVVGRKVLLPCNESVTNLTQLTWKMNRINLLTYMPQGDLHRHNNKELPNMNINISTSTSHMYALIIEGVQTFHTGNYTCVTTTFTGVQEQTWELIITGTEDADTWTKLVVPIAASAASVFCLIFIFALIIMRRTCRRTINNRPPTAVMPEQKEDIYENCLDTNYRASHQ